MTLVKTKTSRRREKKMGRRRQQMNQYMLAERMRIHG